MLGRYVLILLTIMTLMLYYYVCPVTMVTPVCGVVCPVYYL